MVAMQTSCKLTATMQVPPTSANLCSEAVRGGCEYLEMQSGHA